MQNLIILLIFTELLFFLVFAFFIGKNKIQHIIKEPISILLIFFSLIYLFVPLFKIIFGIYEYQTSYTLRSHILTNILLLVYVFSASFGYFLFRRILIKQSKTTFISLSKTEKRSNFLLILIPAIVGAILLLIYALQFKFDYYMGNRVILLQGKGILPLLIYFFYIYFSVYFTNKLIEKRNSFTFKKLLCLPFITSILLISVMSFFLAGSRFSIFILIILPLYIFLLTRDKIKKKHLLKIALFLFLLLISITFFGFIRTNLKPLYEGTFSFDPKDTGYLISDEIFSNFRHYENLLWLVENKDRWHILYGKTFTAGFANFIPRKLYPEKPYGGGPALKNFIYPKTYDQDNQFLSGLTTGLPTEAFMNFSYLGLLAIGFLHGIILLFIKKLFFKIKMSSVDLTLYAYLMLSTYFLLFLEFLGGLTRMIVVVLPLFLIKILRKIRQKTK